MGRILSIVILTKIFSYNLYAKGLCNQKDLVKLSPNISFSYSAKLIREINRAAILHSINCRKIIVILFMESSFQLGALNKITKDYGIGQINKRNIEYYSMDKNKVLTDLAYSIDRSVMLLRWFKDKFSHREPERWVVRYNCGVKPNCINKPRAIAYFNKYKESLRRIYE